MNFTDSIQMDIMKSVLTHRFAMESTPLTDEWKEKVAARKTEFENAMALVPSDAKRAGDYQKYAETNMKDYIHWVKYKNSEETSIEESSFISISMIFFPPDVLESFALWNANKESAEMAEKVRLEERNKELELLKEEREKFIQTLPKEMTPKEYRSTMKELGYRIRPVKRGSAKVRLVYLQDKRQMIVEFK